MTISRLSAVSAVTVALGLAATPAGAQTPTQNPSALGAAPTAGGERTLGAPTRPGTDPILTPNADAQVPTTRNTRGSTPTNDSNSASAQGGPGTGPVPGTSTNR